MSNYARVSLGNGALPMSGQMGCKKVQSVEDFGQYGFQTDFMEYVASGTTLAGWVVTAVNSSTVASSDEIGGVLVATSDTSDGDGIQMQQSEVFKPADAKEIWFAAKIKVADADQTDVFVGLTTTDTSILASNPDNMIGFILADEAADLKYIVRASGTGDAVDTGTDLVDATYVTVGFKVTGTSKVDMYVDDVFVASVTSNIPTTELALSVAMLTGEAAANTLSVDFVSCYQSR